jgi:serine/threonine protein kinase
MTEETLFEEALSRSPEERAAFLEQACAGRPDLRAAVEALLAAHAKPDNVLDKPPVSPGETVDSDPGPGRPVGTGEYTPHPEASPSRATTTDYRPNAEPGAVIAGRYTLVEKIGEGGMGEVWVARQTEPVKRKVAVKLIKGGMDSRAVLARFEQERQALALMDHPHIARVLDGGLTPEGRPFFVMELVNGLPLTRFCDEARLSPRERLELFLAICQAVQHAHQKGIVHRDLKPANILVTLLDGRPVPRVIDFGVAKATAGKLTDESLSTQFGAVVGTLEYMAPEQAGYSGIDIDTRADLYSLGVILYELLTGLRPIDARRLKKAALTEIVRIIQEEEPSRPSTRLSTEESLPALAALRQTEPRKLMALLRGELDWVVMKCLEKQRDRRYETANALSRDVQRYLADEPVEARPPSAGYRLGKFLRRHKGPVLAASLLLLALVGGTVGTTVGMLRAEQRRVEADQARAQEAEQRARAEQARDRTRQALDAMTSFVTGASLSTQIEVSEEQKRFLAEVLTYYREFAGEKADNEAAQARTAKAAFRVGLIESRLGRMEEAVAAVRQARDGFEKLTAEFPAVPEYRQELAGNHYNLGIYLADLGKWAEAEQQYRRALTLQEKLAADFPAVPPYRRDLAASHNGLGVLLAGLGKRTEAEQQYQQALAIEEKLVAEYPAVPQYRSDLASSHINLGRLLAARGKHAGAEGSYRQALVAFEKLAAEYPTVPRYREDLAHSHHHLGLLLHELGKPAEEEEQYQKALALWKRLTAEYPAVPRYRQGLANSHNSLGALRAELGKFAEAEQEFRLALALRGQLTTSFPAVPWYRQELARSHHNLSGLLKVLGKGVEAEKQYRQAIALWDRLVADFPTAPLYRKELVQSHTQLGFLLGGLGKRADAEQQAHQARAHLEKLAADFPDVPEYRADLAANYSVIGVLVSLGGQPAVGLEWHTKAIRTATPLAEQDPRLGTVRQTLWTSHWGRAVAYDLLQRYAEGLPDWDKVIELSPAQEQPRFRGRRAIARVNAGQVAEAVAEVAELTKASGWAANQWYEFACVYAVASSKTADRQQEYANQAMDLLQKAVKVGFTDTAHMKRDTNLNPLRARADFQKLIGELAKQSTTPPEKKP